MRGCWPKRRKSGCSSGARATAGSRSAALSSFRFPTNRSRAPTRARIFTPALRSTPPPRRSQPDRKPSAAMAPIRNPRRGRATPASRLRKYLARARKALKNEQYAEADREFRRVLARDRKHVGALTGRALALDRSGRVAAAALAAKRAIAAAPDDARLQLRLGQLLARQKRTHAAGEATLRAAVRL